MPGRASAYPHAPKPGNNQPVPTFSTTLTLGQFLL